MMKTDKDQPNPAERDPYERWDDAMVRGAEKAVEELKRRKKAEAERQQREKD
jgi:hypothetical protein